MERAKFNPYTQSWYLEHAANIFADMPFGYVLVLPDQKIHSVNRTLQHWLGYSKEELKAKKFTDLLSIGGKIYYETHHLPLEELQGYIHEQSYTLLSCKGKRIPVLIYTKRERDEHTRLLFTQVFINNISDRKKYEHDLLQAKKSAEVAIKAKTQFISTISHEIRTPLQALIGMSDLLLNQQPREDQLPLLQTISFASKNLLQLINHILDFSKSEVKSIEINREPFRLRELIRQTVASLQFIAQEKKLTFTIDIDDRIPDRVLGDPPKISQVLNNILGNAIKFTPKGFIKTRVHLLERVEDHLLVHFAIEDSGIGISKDEVKNIFNSFEQGSNAIQFGGAGLGLAISQNLLNLHQSEIKVESVEGKGSIFSFTLPFQVAPDPVEEKLPALPVSPENLKGIKVLLVEDNVTNIFIITHYLREWQVDFDVAETGSSALEMIRKARYDLVLLDLQMPVMDGFATIQALRSMEKGAYSLLPVVAVSASANHELEKDLLNAGFQDFLQKPFDPVRLYEILLAAAAGDIIVQKQELDPEKPVSKEIAEKLVDFSELDTFLGGDQLVLRQFIEVLLGDWNKIYEELIQSIADRDIKLFLQARHKTISAAGLLKAVRLQFLLDEMRDFLKDPDNPFPEEEQFEELLDVFRKVMDQLQAFLLDEPV